MDDFHDAGDDDLLERTATEPEAFGAFYVRHVAGVLGFFRRRTGDPQLALDLAAETFARALEHAGQFKSGSSPPAAWLYAIARNLLRDSYRRGRVEDDARRRLNLEPLVVSDLGFERVEAAADTARLLAEAQTSGSLSEQQAAAVRARVLEGVSYDELATQLRCSPQVARQHVSRGLRNLRRRTENRP